MVLQALVKKETYCVLYNVSYSHIVMIILHMFIANFLMKECCVRLQVHDGSKRNLFQ